MSSVLRADDPSEGENLGVRHKDIKSPPASTIRIDYQIVAKIMGGCCFHHKPNLLRFVN